jgi:SAM-dependent methyltransferase/LPS sulfotransferase NodH
MSYEEFIQALNKRFGVSQEEQLQGLALQHYAFAKNTNTRGTRLLKLLEERLGLHLKCTRLLDVGCAYGGLCIEAARQGAIAHGVDASESLVELARMNARGVPVDWEIHFLVVDATSPDFPKVLPKDYFDLVVVNDVLEHVHDTAKLLENLSLVSGQNAMLYFEIPNGLSIEFICREGHKGIPGLSIVDPSYWHYRTAEHSSIYYRRWGYYAALFSHFGFGDIELLNFGETSPSGGEQMREYLQARFDDARKAVLADSEDKDDLAEVYKKAMAQRIADVEGEMKDDLDSLSDAELRWKYHTRFWKGVARRHSGTVERSAKELMATDLDRDKLTNELDCCRAERDTSPMAVQYTFRPFIVLTRSRAGSNMLLDMLRSHPQVYVKGEILGNLHGRSIDSILNDVFSRRPDRIKAAGFKLFYYHPLDDDSGAIWDKLDGMAELRIIHLKRRDILRTLTSRKIAGKTDVWSSRKASEKRAVDKRIMFSHDELLQLFRQTRRWEEEFGHRFRDHHIMDVYYEDLVSDREAVFQGIVEFLGVQPIPCPTSLERQNPERLSDLITNYESLKHSFKDTEWARYFVD